MHICIKGVNISEPKLCLDGKLDFSIAGSCIACVCCVSHLCIPSTSCQFIVKWTIPCNLLCVSSLIIPPLSAALDV